MRLAASRRRKELEARLAILVRSLPRAPWDDDVSRWFGEVKARPGLKYDRALLRELLRIGQVAGQRVRMQDDRLSQVLVLLEELDRRKRTGDPVRHGPDPTPAVTERSKAQAMRRPWVGHPESFIAQPSLLIA